MARCPICGATAEIFSSLGERQYYCPHCGLILKRKVGEGDAIHGDLEVVDYIERVVDNIERNSDNARILAQQEYTTTHSLPSSRGSSGRSETSTNRPLTGEEQFIWGHCNYCHAVIVLSNSKFCPNCGASLGQVQEDATPFEMKEKDIPRKSVRPRTKHGKKCMVCNLELGEDNDVTRCPHCGSLAHRTHLLEWVHVKSSCPICGKHLAEQDFRGP